MPKLISKGSFALVVGLMLTPSVRSQEVTVAANATTQLLAWTWSYVGTYNETTMPMGPMPIPGDVTQFTLGAQAAVSWQLAEEAGAVAFELSLDAAGGGSLFQAGFDAFSFVLDLGATPARAIELDIDRANSVSGAATPPPISVDIGNDGTIEYGNVSAGALISIESLTAGPAPLQIAFVVSAVSLDGFSGWGQLADELRVTVRPDNDLDILQEAPGCVPGQPGFDAPTPVFAGHGVDLNFSPGLLIVGFQALPIVWTPQSPLPFVGNCLVVPSPDVLIWEPSGTMRLGLPLSVRPATIHLQSAFLTPLGVGASDAYRVIAN